MYLILKNSHMLLGLISFLFFLIRAIWTFQDSKHLHNKLVKILPHVIDTLLLSTAIALMLTIQQYPFSHSWLTGKIIALIAYIVFASVVIKYAKNHLQRCFYMTLAVLSFTYIVMTAISHNPFFFLYL